MGSQVIGVYLLYLGAKLLMQTKSSSVLPPTVDAAGSRWGLFVTTYLVTAFNPKGVVFFVAFLPQFIPSDSSSSDALWLLSITFVALATLNASFYALLATSARQLLSSEKAKRRSNIFGGCLMSAAGVWALLAKRPA